ncbi:uncharacterized protein LOC144453197 [Glandiceps talaboti]
MMSFLQPQISNFHVIRALLDAAEAGDDEGVKRSLEEGADIESTKSKYYNSDYTALHLASKNGHDAVVLTLLEKGAKIEAKTTDLDNYTALHLASKNGHGAVVQTLLEKGAKIEAKSACFDNYTALHLASENGHDAVVQTLLEKGAMIEVKTTCFERKNSLLLASGNGHNTVVQTLLHKGADIEATDGEEKTSLLLALKNGHNTVVQTLLHKGADIEATDEEEKNSLLLLASKNGHNTVVQTLLHKGADIEATDEWNFTSLLLASDNGHDTVVKTLLQEGADIEAKDYCNYTALHLASKNGHDAVVLTLLEKGAKIEVKTTGLQESSLLLASENGHNTVVQTLLHKGADIEATDRDKYNALHLASKNGHDAVVLTLLEKGAKIEAKTTDLWEATSLLLASENGHNTVVQTLLHKGADIEATDEWNSTSLLLASQNGHDTVVKTLLQEGADIEAKDNEKRTALHYALNDSVVRILLQNGANIEATDNMKRTPLHLACKERHAGAVVKILLQKGANIEATDTTNMTALHIACEIKGNDAVVEMLLEKGANVEATDNGKRTALHVASLKGEDTVVKILLENGANIEATDNMNRTPLHIACTQRKGAVVKILLQKGANMEANDTMNRTPLHIACTQRKGAVVKILLQKGANMEANDTMNRTPLHIACTQRKGAVVKILLQKGANMEANDTMKRTPLHLACKERHAGAVVKILLQKGANIEATDTTNMTALHIACEIKGNDAVVEMLLEKGANVDATDNDGMTAVQLAHHHGHDSLVNLFVKAENTEESEDDEMLTTTLDSLADENNLMDIVSKFAESEDDVGSTDQRLNGYNNISPKESKSWPIFRKSVSHGKGVYKKRPMKCSKCSLRFYDSKHKNEHEKIHATFAAVKKAMKKTSKKGDYPQLEQQTIQLIQRKTRGKCSVSCQFCSEEFFSTQEKKEHEKMHAKKTNTGDDGGEDKMPSRAHSGNVGDTYINKIVRRNGKCVLKCSTCNEYIFSVDDKNEHEKRHIAETISSGAEDHIIERSLNDDMGVVDTDNSTKPSQNEESLTVVEDSEPSRKRKSIHGNWDSVCQDSNTIGHSDKTEAECELLNEVKSCDTDHAETVVKNVVTESKEQTQVIPRDGQECSSTYVRDDDIVPIKKQKKGHKLQGSAPSGKLAKHFMLVNELSSGVRKRKNTIKNKGCETKETHTIDVVKPFKKQKMESSSLDRALERSVVRCAGKPSRPDLLEVLSGVRDPKQISDKGNQTPCDTARNRKRAKRRKIAKNVSELKEQPDCPIPPEKAAVQKSTLSEAQLLLHLSTSQPINSPVQDVNIPREDQEKQTEDSKVKTTLISTNNATSSCNFNTASDEVPIGSTTLTESPETLVHDEKSIQYAKTRDKTISVSESYETLLRNDECVSSGSVEINVPMGETVKTGKDLGEASEDCMQDTNDDKPTESCVDTVPPTQRMGYREVESGINLIFPDADPGMTIENNAATVNVETVRISMETSSRKHNYSDDAEEHHDMHNENETKARDTEIEVANMDGIDKNTTNELSLDVGTMKNGQVSVSNQVIQNDVEKQTGSADALNESVDTTDENSHSTSKSTGKMEQAEQIPTDENLAASQGQEVQAVTPRARSKTNGRKCDICGKIFSKSSNMLRHKRQHSETSTTVTCKICDATFTTKQNLKEHLVVHNDARAFICDICNNSYKRNKDLLRHKREKH